MNLKITFSDGATKTVAFDANSTIAVTSVVGDPASGLEERTVTWTDVAQVETVEDAPPVDEAPADAPTTEAAPVEETAPVEPAVEPVEEPAADPVPVEEPAAVADPATLETPQAAIDHADTLASLPDAQAHIDAALEKFPGDPDLVAAKAELDELEAAGQPPAQA